MILFCFGLTEAVTMALSFIGIWINDYIIPCVCVCTDTGDLAEKKSQKLTRVRVEKKYLESELQRRLLAAKVHM